jgi:hypothetical protein
MQKIKTNILIIITSVILGFLNPVIMAMDFTRVTTGDIVTSSGHSWSVNWIDYDNDSYLDLFVSNLDTDNELYRNNGDGTFTLQAVSSLTAFDWGIAAAGASWSDIDNDGNIDVFIARFREGGPPYNKAFLNNGDGTFTEISNSAIVEDAGMAIDASWADYNNDGLIDLYVANHEIINHLYRQDDTGFAKIEVSPIGTDVGGSNSAAWADIDNDNDVDVIAANGWGDYLDHFYENTGDGNFSRITGDIVATATNLSWGASWGDYDNDGDQDLLLTSSIFGSPSISYDYLYNNDGNGSFTHMSAMAPSTNGASTFGSTWGDFDNDGDLDLAAVASGTNLLYSNNGDGSFTKINTGDLVTESHESYGIACGDYDKDGDLDVFVTNVGTNNLFENNGNSNNWVNIKCIGQTSNYSAIGTKVRLRAIIGGNPVWQLREISSRTGKGAQNSLNAHFGLGDASIIDSIKIEWPSGMIDTLTNVTINQFLSVTESTCGDVNGDQSINIKDITDLIKYKYKGGSPPQPYECLGNVNGDTVVNIKDITYLIKYKYKAGAKPVFNCCNPMW